MKFNPDGSVDRLKARLVAKGYTQTYEVDYSDTFSLMAKMTSVLLFISLATCHDWDLHQLATIGKFCQKKLPFSRQIQALCSNTM